MSMRAALCAAAVAAGLVFSGCSAPQIEPEVARELQSEVQGIAVLAARGDTADAVAAAHGLAARVRTAQVEGRITGERAVVILQRVEQLIERLVRSGAGPAASDLPQPLAGPPSAPSDPPVDQPEEPPADPTEEPEEPDPEKDTEPDPEEAGSDETEELPVPEPAPVADAPLLDAPLLDTVTTDSGSSGSSGSGTSGNSGTSGGGTGTGQQEPILPAPAVGNDAANNGDGDDGGKGRGRGRGGDD